MKKLGLVGGMGPESTIPYYHDIVYGVQKRTGYFPPLTIESVDVFKVLELCKNEEYKKLSDYLMDAIFHLAESGADFAALSANTPHIIFDELQERSPIPLVSILESTCEEVKRRHISKVGLLGTIFTMDKDFYKRPFIRDQIEIITPNYHEKKLVNQKISSELELGIVKDETLAEFIEIIKPYEE
jgi:aspartate racemase